MRQARLAVAPIPELYIRWRDPETNKVVRMEKVTPADMGAALRLEGWIPAPRAGT